MQIPDHFYHQSYPTAANQMRLDVRCPAAPWENTTREEDVAYDIAYNLAEEYQQPVDLYYNQTGTLCTTVYP